MGRTSGTAGADERGRDGVGGDGGIVGLGCGDLAAGLALSTEAGWNQTAADWAMVLRVGDGFGIADDGGRVIATGFALPYPPDLGWISLILVTAAQRRRGLATRLLDHAVAHLTRLGLVPVLDATPAGAAVYRPRGFVALEPISRWRGPGGGSGRPRGVERLAAVEAADLYAADAAAFGADRREILVDICGRSGALALVDREAGGFLLGRRGRTATQLGPLVAADDGAAARLLEAGLSLAAGPVLLDLPDRERALAARLAGRGFKVERRFTRMARGRDRPFGDPAAMRVIAGPELG